MGRRYLIVGISGSGKTTLACALGARVGLPVCQLDLLVHGPGWSEAPDDALRARVSEFMRSAPDGWVIDGSYDRKLGDLLLEQADTLVWLDDRIERTLFRLVRRSMRRLITRERILNGNVETLRGVFWGRESLLGWAIRSHRRMRVSMPDRLWDDRFGHLTLVRLCSLAEMSRWIAAQDEIRPRPPRAPARG
jgi:adenylate kinase family enzyme